MCGVGRVACCDDDGRMPEVVAGEPSHAGPADALDAVDHDERAPSGGDAFEPLAHVAGVVGNVQRESSSALGRYEWAAAGCQREQIDPHAGGRFGLPDPLENQGEQVGSRIVVLADDGEPPAVDQGQRRDASSIGPHADRYDVASCVDRTSGDDVFG